MVAVIINHVNENLLPGGYLGVDIFFVISGFVITSSLANRPSKSFGDFLLEFYSKRVRRIVPALVLFVMWKSSFTLSFLSCSGSPGLGKLSSLAHTAENKGVNVVVFSPLPVFRGDDASPVVMCRVQWFRPSLPDTCNYGEKRQKILHELDLLLMGCGNFLPCIPTSLFTTHSLGLPSL